MYDGIDVNRNGIVDALEGSPLFAVDTDGDGIENFRDVDNDNDAISDIVELALMKDKTNTFEQMRLDIIIINVKNISDKIACIFPLNLTAVLCPTRSIFYRLTSCHV